MQAGGDQHQRYLLLCALVRHSAGAELRQEVRLAVLEQALLEAQALEPTLAFPALVFTLKVSLPPCSALVPPYAAACRCSWCVLRRALSCVCRHERQPSNDRACQPDQCCHPGTMPARPTCAPSAHV